MISRLMFLCLQCQAQSIFGDTIYLSYCKLKIKYPQMVGAEGMKIFNFGNPRLLEKALHGKELHQKLLY